jgi:serine/threonine-protein phosphatase PGAM5
MGTRYLYLVRHGQYDIDNHLDDRGGGLTETGRQQADHTAEALKRFPLNAVYCSSMRRAFETAERIAVPQGLAPHAFDSLREIIPCIPPGEETLFGLRFPNLTHEKTAQEREVANKAFERFFRPSEDIEDEHEVVVCHGNIIRYFACRVLGAPFELWTRMESHYCGVTRCAVDESQYRLVSLNDTGHLPADLQLSP